MSGGWDQGKGGEGRDSGSQRNMYSDGLNPNRQKGFGVAAGKRIETPTLNDMRARQGAVVGKFLNFMHRKNSIVIELYDKAFFAKRPTWESLANFVYSDLCPSADLRSEVFEVQLHPVKMMLFVKFKSENSRDQVVARLQAANGLMWTDYGVRVKGHSLDATVKIITVLGASPETTEEEMKSAFVDTGIGEVLEVTRGLLDEKRLPGVFNGKWKVRVKILDPEKVIPSYIIRKDEGELWSLLFDGRRFVCWKCGSADHIGDKCREFEKTFEEVFGDNNDNDGGTAPVSWAAIVKGNGGLSPDLTMRRDNYAKQIREFNAKKAKDKKDAEERKEAELAHQERLRTAEVERQHQIAKEAKQQEVMDEAKESQHDSITGLARRAIEEVMERQNEARNGLDDDEENLRIVTALAQPSLVVSGSVHGLLDQQHNEVVGVDVAQSAGNEGVGVGESPLSLNSTLENVFGAGATQLAKNLESNSDKMEELEISDEEINLDSEVEHLNISTPVKDQRKKRGRKKINFGSLNTIEGIKGNHGESSKTQEEENHGVSSEGEHSEEVVKENKKPRLGESNETQTHEESSETQTHGEDDSIENLEKNIIKENKTTHSEDLEEEIVGDKDNTAGLKEEDKIFEALSNLHEDVPLGDPGPNTSKEDEGEEAAGATR